MLSLIKIEWLKIKKYPGFWLMLGFVALTYPGINYFGYSSYESLTAKKNLASAILKGLLGNPYAFPETWHSVAFFSSLFVVVPSIMVIMIITNEYVYKTSRQNIIDGWSRDQFVTSKILDVFIISFVATLMYALTAIGYGFIMLGQGINNNKWTDEIKFIPLFLLQTFAQLTIAFFLGFIIRRAFIALGIFIFYFLIVENSLIAFAKVYDIRGSRFLPLEISDKIIPRPVFFKFIDPKTYARSLTLVNEHICYTIILTAAIWMLCYWINRKRDI